MTFSSQNRSTWIPKPKHAWKRIERMLPRDTCGSYHRCGANGLCDTNSSPNCICLQGFKPKDPEAWQLHDWTGGCVTKKPLNCSVEGFLNLTTMKLPETASSTVDRTIHLQECKEKCLRNCSCTAYANTDMRNGGSGCVIWLGELLDLRKNIFAGQDLFVRSVATDAIVAGNKKKTENNMLLIVGAGVVLLLLLIGFVIFFFWKRNKRPTRAKTPPRPIGGLQCAPLALVDVAAATDNFAHSNKIGQGGYGIVYKGTLLNGQSIAAKRLLKRSDQGIGGFTNEVELIGRVQHINLVHLFAYCFEGEEMILIYEFLDNSSLDAFIFDKTQSFKLNWTTRMLITHGIARGLLYLHQDSRFRIIHRDLKPSNILLDKDMVPKISDFGMAKLFDPSGGTQASTTKMVGTRGYMSPEYAIDGIYSVKSDVFSFGVLVLEIITGKRNTEFFCSNEESLLNYIWRMWKEGKGLEIVDPVIVETSPTIRPNEVARCIQIGLLCVQECAEDRPDMQLVLLMLTSERTEIDHPNPPGYFEGTSTYERGSSSTWTVPQVTNSTIEGR